MFRAVAVGVAVVCACGTPPATEDAATSLDGGLTGPDAPPLDAAADAGDGGLAPDVTEYARDLEAALCAMYVRCESYFSLGSLRETYQGWSCHPEALREWARTHAAVAAGTVGFDPVAAATCLEELASADCSVVLSRVFEPCDSAWIATVPPGGPCAMSRECIDGRCIADAECPGTCVALGGVGTACTSTFIDCRSDLVCVSGSCRERAGAGGACAAAYECSPGLNCAGGVCAAFPGTGESCAGGLACAGALVCDPASATCATGGTEGESCSSTPCSEWMRCDEATETCVRAALPGEACSLDAECPYAFFCQSGVCAPLPVAGEPCADAPACSEGACVSGTCTLLSDGEDCGVAWPPPIFGVCAEGFYCDSEVCTSRLPDGAGCDPWAGNCIETHECRGDVCRERCGPIGT